MVFKSFREACAPFLGSFYSFLATISICLFGLTFKYVSRPSGLQATFVLMCVFYMASLPVTTYKLVYLKKTPSSLPLKIYIYFLMCILSGICACLLTVVALEYSSIADVYAIGSSYMIPMLLFSYLFLNEKPHWVEILLALASVGGIFLVARPSFLFDQGIVYDLPQIKGLVFACAICIAMAIRLTCDSKISSFINNSVILLWTGGLGAFLTLIIIGFLHSNWFLPVRMDCLWYTLGALFALISRILLIQAVKIERTNRVGMIYSSQVFLAYVFDTVVTSSPPNYISVIGGTVIVFSSVASLLLKVWIVKRKKKQNNVIPN